jgi:hypothetical protein
MDWMSEFGTDNGYWDYQDGGQGDQGFPWHDHSDEGLSAAWDGSYAAYGDDGGSGYQAPAEVGNPAEYRQDWFFQEQNGYCVPSSLTEVISAQSGIPLPDYSLVEQEAARLGLPATGLTLPQAQELLGGFGVPSHIEYGGDPQTAAGELAGFLSQGRNVMLAVNASPIWYGSADSPDNPDGQADHAAVTAAVERGLSGGEGADVAAAHSATAAHAVAAGFVVLPIAFAGAWGYTALRARTRRGDA